VLAAEAEARWAAQRAAHGDIGKLVVGFGGSSALGFLSGVVATHRSRYPLVELELHELGSHEQIERLLSRRLHVGLLRERAPDDRITEEVLQREPLIAVLPARHRLAGRKRIAVRDLAGEPFVLAPRAQSSSYTDAVLAACAEAGFQPTVVQEASETIAILALVAGGLGVSLLAAGVQTVRAKGVVYRPIHPKAPTIELSVAWRHEETSALVAAFVETCRVTAARVARSG
jgi:DNA-binding transcriptional LysR family regulator